MLIKSDRLFDYIIINEDYLRCVFADYRCIRVDKNYVVIIFYCVIYHLSQSAPFALVLVVHGYEVLRFINQKIIEPFICDGRIMIIDYFLVRTLA